MAEAEITIERVEELRLSETHETAIAALIKKTYSADFGGRSFFQNRHHCRFMAYQHGALVGHLALAYRAIRLGNHLVDIVGIAEVAVAVPARKQGIASELVQCAIEEGNLAGADFAALFGEEALYSQAGFKNAHNVIITSQMEGALTGEIVTSPNTHFMVRALGDMQWDADALVDLAGFPF